MPLMAVMTAEVVVLLMGVVVVAMRVVSDSGDVVRVW